MVTFTEERLARVKEIIARYPEGRQKKCLATFAAPCAGTMGLVKYRNHGLCGRPATIGAY